jgi:hypothetical protein
MITNLDPGVRNSPLIAWDNLVPQGTLAATSTAAGFLLSALTNGVTTDPWRPASMPATVTLTLPVARAASCLAFAAHDMHTAGVTATLQRLVGADWVTVATVTPASNAPFMVAFLPLTAAGWRVTFTGGVFRVAVMHLSNAMTVPGVVQPPHTPLHRVSEVDLVGESESGTGEFLQADFQRTGGRASLDFGVQLPLFALGEFEAFRQHFNRGRPFFIACTPTYEPLDMGYCWRANGAPSIVPAYRDAVFMDIPLEVSVYV